MTPLFRTRSRARWWYALGMVATIAAGLASRRFPQVLPAVLGKYPGDALWALMVFFGVGVIFRRTSTLRVAVGALAFAFGIEVLKLWPSSWLAELRHTTVGHLVLGRAFSWPNLVAYTVGVLAGVIIEVMVARDRAARPSA